MDVSSALLNSALVDNSEVEKEIVDHIINTDLKSLRIKNMNKMIVGQLNMIISEISLIFLRNKLKVIYIYIYIYIYI